MNKSHRYLLVMALTAIMLVPAVIAKESIFHDDIASGYSIDVDDDYTFVITLNRYASAIFVNGGDIFQSVQIGECKTLGEIYDVCFINTTYDLEEDDLYAEVEIFRKEADVSVTKTVNETEMVIGQKAEATLTIANDGDNLEQVTLLDDYPKEIRIEELEGPGCYLHENTVGWSGHLNQGESKTCTFRIIGLEEVHKELTAKVRYWTGLKWETEYSAKRSIDIEPAIKVEAIVVREDFEVDGKTIDLEDENPDVFVGEQPRLIIKITKEIEEDADVDIEVKLPKGVSYLKTDYLRFNYEVGGNHESDTWNSERVSRIGDQKVRFSKSFDKNKTERYIILKLDTARSGLQNIMMDLDYNIEPDDISYSQEEKESFLVYDPGVYLTATVDDDSELFSIPKRLTADDEEEEVDIQSNHPYRLTVYAQNKNAYGSLSDVNFRIMTDIANFSNKHYTKIEEEDQVIPWGLTLIPPMLLSDKTYKMNISATYTNEFGESVVNSTAYDFNVKAFKPIEIKHDSEEGYILEGKEKTMFKVTLDNQRVTDIKNVFVRDEIPEAFDVLGVTSNKLKLVADEESEVYKYEITPPVVKEKTKYNITTYVSYFDEDSRQAMNYSEVTTITVIPREPSVDVDLEMEDPETIYQGAWLDGMLKIKNDEEEEIMRDITVHFGLTKDYDLIGPRTFYIDRLEPEESIELRNIFQYRPKGYDDNLDIPEISVEYYDQYGSRFFENTSTESLDVKKGRMSGPALYLINIVPPLANLSSDIVIKIEARNKGNEPATGKVFAGDRSWDINLGPSGYRIIEYRLKYDKPGNYTVDAPTATIGYQGKDMHVGSTEKKVEVKFIPAEVEIPEPEVEQLPEVETVPATDLDKIEESMIQEEEQQAKKTNLAIYLIVGAVALLGIIVYIFYQRGKKKDTAPFLK